MQFAFAHVLRGEGKEAVAIGDCAVERARDLHVDKGHWAARFVEHLALDKGLVLCKGGHSETEEDDDLCPSRCGCGDVFHVLYAYQSMPALRIKVCKAFKCVVKDMRPFSVRLYQVTGFRFSNRLSIST